MVNYLNAGTDHAGQPVHLFYQDLGQGPETFVLIHGWPLDHQSWAYQLAELPRQGYRVVAYDRRGFGKSSKPTDGYDYDTFAADLHAVLTELDLRNVTLVGFSMGGGEVARYIGRYGTERVARAVLVSAVTPYMLQTPDNPNGVPPATFDQMLDGLRQDRPDFLASFAKQFYNVNLLKHPVSQATLDWHQALALQAAQAATEDCVKAFAATDFRQDLAALRHVPTLLIHGTADQIVPIGKSAEQTARLVPHATFLRYEDAPHGLFITEKDRLTRDLVAFIKS